MPLRLVIFDCDGVLVDSETVQIRVMVESMAGRGLHMPLDEAMPLFRGRKMAECVAEMERRLGSSLPESFVPDLRAAMADVFRRELRPIPGIFDALDAISTPKCVASNAPLEKMRLTLGITGLLPRFEGRMFSSYEVGSWKPDPGLFLHACRAMGASPEECAVVEDSVLGVRAALAAGMRALGFSHLAEDRQLLESAGAIPFGSMSELPGLLAR
jgi:HAD superfamily hydrolase (TIGR01509 family)